MTDRYEVEVLLRPPVEWVSAWVSGSAALLVLQLPEWLLMPPFTARMSAGGLAMLCLWRAHQGWRVLRYQRYLRCSPRYELAAEKIPVSHHVQFLGRGFRWTQTHTERLYAARDRRAEHYLRPNALQRWAQTMVLAWEQKPPLRRLSRWLTQDSPWNPLRPPPASGGDPVIHGVGMDTETDVTMPLSDRVGHTVVIARTRHGKTRLAELLTTQDIHRGNNCVIVLDPKGDADYLKRIYAETRKAQRPLIIFHLGYPSLSARYNAIGAFSRTTEVATRIASQLPGEGEASAFKEFAWQFINVIAVALVALGERPDFVKIRRYIADIDPLLVRYGHDWLARHGPADWADALAETRAALNPKSIPRGEQGKDPDAVALARYLKPLAGLDSVLEGLLAAFRYEREYFQKITVAVKPFLEKLTTGNLAGLLAPDPNDDTDTRPVLTWAQAIRQQAVVYVGLDALTDPEVASAVGATMFSDLTSLAGYLYKHGIEGLDQRELQGQSPLSPSTSTETATPTPSAGESYRHPNVIIHGDEFSDLIGPQFKTLINKSGGAGYALTLYTQTWSDPIAELGSEAKAGQLAGNIGTVIIMGVKEIATCEMVTRQLPEVSVSEIMAVSGVTDRTETDSGIGFTSSNQDRISVSRVPMISPADIVALPKGQAFALLKGSELWKIRIPLPSPLDDATLPKDLGGMLAHMRQHYLSVMDWDSYEGR